MPCSPARPTGRRTMKEHGSGAFALTVALITSSTVLLMPWASMYSCRDRAACRQDRLADATTADAGAASRSHFALFGGNRRVDCLLSRKNARRCAVTTSRHRSKCQDWSHSRVLRKRDAPGCSWLQQDDVQHVQAPRRRVARGLPRVTSALARLFLTHHSGRIDCACATPPLVDAKLRAAARCPRPRKSRCAS